ncbi:Protein D1-like isoform X2 [Aphelenchoides besseyi]|nr:Protein D1-like isoform X2 [Aphelenchoides besseyi]
MKSLLFVVFFCLTLITVAREYYDYETIKFWYEYNDIVPDVMKEPPKEHALVEYGMSTVDLGNVISARFTTKEPRVKWRADRNAYYTIAMFDPDIPSRKDPKMGQYRYCSYYEPEPRENTGWHRYVFAVYKQRGKLGKLEEKDDEDDRTKWDAERFAKRNGLQLVAGSYFVSKFEK